MTIFAVIKNNIVVNKIMAESKEIAETVTGLSCVEIESTLVAELNSSYLDGKFLGLSPYPSWTYNHELDEWTAPVEKPEDENFYTWSEEDLEWKIVTE